MRLTERAIELPALASAHSHAFQRGMRGEAQRPGPSGADDFWSWRSAMYALAESLTPESIHAISKVAYRELRAAGVRTVGEFHYVHHQPGGAPYADRTVLADAVIEAAREEGLRIALLRVVYARAGAGRAPEGAQRRFSDASLDAALADVEALRARYAGCEDVRVGVAPHSVRAVPPAWLGEIARYAAERGLMVHMHVAEQPAEIDACLAETGRRPVELLAERGVLGDRFVAVHATHLAPHEPALLGAARAFACLCPTTERDLGDGLPDVGALRAAGARLCVGIDSHVITDPFEDMRGVELGERLRTGRRVTLRGEGGATPAEALWEIGSQRGAEACGFADPGGSISVRRDAPALAMVREERLLDAVVYSGSPSIVEGSPAPPGPPAH
ncbi:putative chlorohydrolase [Sorangium cellulosum So ce56]|uniref:Chlorohydrolase n=1 Tax=Sorangium cellulosum (strain So ce56) TaxID=448385 RepID=A9EUP5_SORC5|nr:formimidoylglutamate deiminase [Sorangium cellulosum]CAN91118.1 putative chlorohydrolase [Sorangium cellulosum So ce56]